MRSILRIARLELQVMFFSPIAWLISIAFSIEAAIHMSAYIHDWVMAKLRGEHPQNLTYWTYGLENGIWIRIEPTLTLYVALLTMGVFSREISSGSMKLLLSSPTRPLQIVLGKYLGLLGYGLVLMFICALMVAGASVALGNQDYGMIISGMLGLYLLIAAYMALGLLMSSLTSHQTVAAICTFSIIAVLGMVNDVWQQFDLWREITYFIQIRGRTARFYNGLLSTSDLVYFILVPALFLGCAVIKLQNDRNNRSRPVKMMRYLAFVSVLICLGYLSSRPAAIGYVDFTVAHSGTPTPVSRQVYANVKAPVKVHVYINVLDEQANFAMPWQKRFIIDRFAQAQPYIPSIEFDWTYFYDSVTNQQLFNNNPGMSLHQLAMKVCKVSGLDSNIVLTPQQIRSRIDLRGEENRVVMQVEIGGKKAFLRHYEFSWPEEAEVNAVLKKLTSPSYTIGYVTGHGERDFTKALDEVGYKHFFCDPNSRLSMYNQGFDVTAVSLTQGDVSPDVDILVIADPVAPYTPEELARLKAYIDKGGHLVFAGEQGRQQALAPIGDLIGVRFGTGVLVQPTRDFAPSLIKPAVTAQAERIVLHNQASVSTTPLPPGVVSGKPYLTQFIEGGAIVEMQGAAALEYVGGSRFQADTLLSTDTALAWQRARPVQVDTGMVQFDAVQGDVKRIFPLGLALRRQVGSRQQRIVVLGDADCMSNAYFRKTEFLGYLPHMPANFILMMESLRWMADGQYPVDIARPNTPDNIVKINRKQYKGIRLALEWVLPGLLLLAGSLLLFWRKRK